MPLISYWRWLVALTRWAALRLAGLIRVLAIVAVAVGLGLGAADYSNGEFMMQLALYGLLPAAVAVLVAERLTRFGNTVDEDDGASEPSPQRDDSTKAG